MNQNSFKTLSKRDEIMLSSEITFSNVSMTPCHSMDYIFRKLDPSEWSKLTYLSDPNTEVLPKTRNLAAYLDFALYWHKCTICFQIRIYNKFDDFSFQIVNLFLNRIIFFAISYEVCLLQYTRISGVCFLRTKKNPKLHYIRFTPSATNWLTN